MAVSRHRGYAGGGRKLMERAADVPGCHVRSLSSAEQSAERTPMPTTIVSPVQ